MLALLHTHTLPYTGEHLGNSEPTNSATTPIQHKNFLKRTINVSAVTLKAPVMICVSSTDAESLTAVSHGGLASNTNGLSLYTAVS